MKATKSLRRWVLPTIGIVAVLAAGCWWLCTHQKLNAVKLLGQDYTNWQHADSTQPVKVVSVDAGDGTLDISDSNAPWKGFTVTTAAKQPMLVFDFGQLVLGTPVVTIGSTGGGDMILRYDENVNGSPVKELTQTNAFSLTPSQPTITDAPRLFRYLTISFRNHPKPTTIASIVLKDVRQANRQGFFASSDNDLNAIWQLAAHSVELSTAATFIDSPHRDNATWLGDAREIQLNDAYLSRNKTAADATLKALAGHVRPDGAVVAVNGLSPDNHEDWVFLDYLSRFVGLVWNNYQIYGDRSVLTKYNDVAMKQLEYLKTHTDADGLIVVDPTLAPTYDWSSTKRTGVVAYQQLAYWQGLTDGASIQAALGNKAKAAELSNLADHVKATTRLQLTDSATGLLKDFIPAAGVEAPHIPLDANILAITGGWFSQEEAAVKLDTLSEKLGSDYGWKALDTPYKQIEGRFDISPYMNAYAVQALFSVNKEAEALALTKAVWGNMRHQGATTSWEFVSNNGQLAGSVSHGWSGGIARVLQQKLLGIEPGTDANHWVVAPYLSSETTLSGAVSTNHGVLAITVSHHETDYQVTIQVPAGDTAAFEPGEGMLVDGKSTKTLAGGYQYSLVVTPKP